MSRILVVEDSPTQALEVAYDLEAAGLEVVIADDGNQALDTLSQETFDLVLTDIQMPGMSGYELCRRIRMLPDSRHIPVVLLTTLNSPSDILRGLECQADNYITKPYSTDYLLQRVRGALGNRESRSRRSVSVGMHLTVGDEQYHVGPDLEKTLDFLITTIEECMRMRDLEHERRLSLETQRFFTVSLDLLAIVGMDGRFKRLNPAWESTLGYPVASLLGRTWTDFVHDNEVEAARRHLVFGGTSFETRFRCQDGSYRRLLWSVASAVDDQAYYVAARDITFRANEEDAARLRARLQTAMAALGQRALVESDMAALKSIAADIVREALDTDECSFLEMQSDGTLLVDQNGHWPMAPNAAGMASSLSVVVPGRGAPYGVLATQSRRARSFGHEETTFLEGIATLLASALARNGAEEELRQSEERNRLLLDSTAEAIFGIDLHGVCTFCNPATLQLLGYQHSDQLLGKHMHDLIHHSREDGSPYPASECPVERGEVVHVDDEVLWRADGTYFYAEYWSYPVRRGDERLGGVVTFLDITSRRVLEQQFRHAQKMEAVGRLAGGIAHDFNNLLTVVAGYCTLLEEDRVVNSPEGRGMLVEINKAALRATTLTRQLLSFSRRQVSKVRTIELNALVGDVDKLLRRLVGADVTLLADLSPEPLTVRADPAQVEQVLVNLIVNARDAMPQGGTIHIRTTAVNVGSTKGMTTPSDGLTPIAPGAYFALSVADTGLGIPAEVMTHIFEPFFTTKEEGKGTGLGLSTVFGIVQQSRAHIDVQSEVGRGTTFTIYFPTAERDVKAPPPRLSLVHPMSAGAETVLVVEDDPELRRLAAIILERQGYKVLLAPDGASALALCRSYAAPVHLLLTDLVMPDLGSRDLLEQLTQLRPLARLLVTSGNVDLAALSPAAYLPQGKEADPALEAGSRSSPTEARPPEMQFLQKPYTPGALLRAVRRCLDGGPQEGEGEDQDQDVA